MNLTSERVRTALAMIEGIRAGQNMASLLGYQFERGRHDRHNLAEVDKFIYKLRKAFPLRADRLASTKTEEGVPIEAIEARNVVDGLALVEHMAATGSATYPFGKTGLPAATATESAAIDAEAERLRDTHDAVADLALAEGVYQAVLGNYDRVASTYDAYARGNFPPEPDVVRTPLNGIGITHRVALHLEAGVSPAVSPVAGMAMTPRAQAEPALNRWLAGVLPGLDQVGCLVAYRSAATGTAETLEVNLHQLGLQPADVVAIVGDDDRQFMSELDDRVLRHAAQNADPRPDVPVTIEYMKAPTLPFSVFQVMPLVRSLRFLTTRSRSLRPTDFVSTTEARSEQDVGRFVDKAGLDLVRAAMLAVRTDLAAFALQLEAPLSDLANRRNEIVTNADAYVDDLADLLARAASFGVAQSGWGFAYDLRRRAFAGILGRVAEVVARWDARLVELAAKLAAAAGAASDEEKLELLAQAERTISTVPTPLPLAPAAYENLIVNVKKPPFDTKHAALAAVASTTRRDVSLLLADVEALLPIDAFDFAAVDLTPFGDELVRLAQDALSVVNVVLAALDSRLAESQAHFDAHDAATTAPARVTALEQATAALLGEGFRIVPEIELTAALGDELANAVAASTSGDLFDYLQNPTDPGRPPVDFPVDEWLYGVARVRDKLNAWEQTVMVAGALGRPEPELVALQLPVLPNDRWLGLEFPPDLNVDVDRLLYTVHLSVPFDKTKRQCGLLLDEWTETIPVQTVDTGITFHHDRPNSEAPQAMLLVTPAQFRGTWRWDDLIDALNETLDLAKRRAVEPRHIDQSPYGWLLPATVMASQVRELTIAAELALNNQIVLSMES